MNEGMFVEKNSQNSGVNLKSFFASRSCSAHASREWEIAHFDVRICRSQHRKETDKVLLKTFETNSRP